jgi:hypothetical protein
MDVGIMPFDIWTIPDESDLSEVRDILVENGMFNPDRSGTDHPDEEWTDEIVYEQNENFTKWIEYDQMQSLKEAFPEEYKNA